MHQANIVQKQKTWLGLFREVVTDEATLKEAFKRRVRGGTTLPQQEFRCSLSMKHGS
jgi:hypothetical protein